MFKNKKIKFIIITSLIVFILLMIMIIGYYFINKQKSKSLADLKQETYFRAGNNIKLSSGLKIDYCTSKECVYDRFRTCTNVDQDFLIGDNKFRIYFTLIKEKKTCFLSFVDIQKKIIEQCNFYPEEVSSKGDNLLDFLIYSKYVKIEKDDDIIKITKEACTESKMQK